MRFGIIGAGISGLSISRLLEKSGNEAVVLERSMVPGGIARTRVIGDVAYHLTGGHCFNSKHQDVLNFVFNDVLSYEEWHKVKRRSRIFFKGRYISYPIEYALKEIAEFDLDLASKMVIDYYARNEEDRSNLATWFVSKFGSTLANEYFIPYNEKIWNRKATEMSPDWVEDKLPMPDKFEFSKALLIGNKDSMPHSVFYYPNTNNQNTFIESLAEGLHIKYNYEVTSIRRNDSKWIVNNELVFDCLISTVPLNILPYLIDSCPNEIIQHAKKLKYNRVSNMLWRTKGNSDTWTYYPDKDSIFHRHIHIGNFYEPNQNITITEAVGDHTYEEMKEEGKKFDYLIEPVDWHVSEHAYVVFDNNYKQSRRAIFDYLETLGLYTLGRFGEWEYYNMDVCIKSAIELSAKLINK
jgi:protoporphyrinogen oxidase